MDVSNTEFRGWVIRPRGSGPRTCQLERLRLRPLQPDRVVVRTEAAACCYVVASFFFNEHIYANKGEAGVIPGHGGVGVVEAVGSKVSRVAVGDRVIVPISPRCGYCYSCLRGRPDACLMAPRPLDPVAETEDGKPVMQNGNVGGNAELMVPIEENVVPVTTNVPAVELALLGCPGAAGLTAAMTFVSMPPPRTVAVLGAGCVGLSAIQGARIMGTPRIIAVEPIAARRELALRLGATVALDPNAEGDKLVSRIKLMCKADWTRTRESHHFDGFLGPFWGPDLTIEAAGGDLFPPKVEAGPDPTGVLSLQQAWLLTPPGGHLVTLGFSQQGAITLPASLWSVSAKTHHAMVALGDTLRDLPRFVDFIERGLYDAKTLVTSVHSIADTRDAYQAVVDRTTIAAIMVP